MALHEQLAVVMALHEPLAMALHGSPVSLSDELFARPRADPRVLFPHASSRAARGCVWSGCTQHHSLPSPPRAARVEGVVSRALTCGLLNAAPPRPLQPLCVEVITDPVRSARAEGLSSPVGSPECGCDRDSRVLLWSVPAASFAASCRGPASCFGLRGALPPKLSRCDSSQLSPLRLAVCLVVSGHSSTQTCSN